MAIVWFCLETGSRRRGSIGLRVGDLLFHAGCVRLGEKNGKFDDQPVSTRRLEFLLGHGLRRSHIVIDNPSNSLSTRSRWPTWCSDR